MDSCDGWEDYFLSQDEVDAWSKDAIGKSIMTDLRDTDGNPYTDQWVNMKNDMNLSMWGSLRRLGFLFLFAGMDSFYWLQIWCKVENCKPYL